MTNDLERDGFAIVPSVIQGDERQELLAALALLSGGGCRGLLDLPAVAKLGRSERMLRLVRPHVPAEPFPVRAIYFQKSPETNWMVPWHQDLTLALRSRVEVPGFGPWTTKDGIPHAQPPMAFLKEMLTIRLHLDDTDETNGALRVLPGSHRFGRLSHDQIQKMRTEQSEAICAASRGDALLMRPLLLHASSRVTTTRLRRVLHIEYAASALPAELDWYEAA